MWIADSATKNGQVKADKYVERKCFDRHSSPQTPISNLEAQNSLECSSECPVTYGSPDEMVMKDLNPCLTPWFSKTKSKEYDQISGYDFPSKNRSFKNSAEFSPNFSSCRDGILSKSSEHCQQPRHCFSTARKIYKSDESKCSTGKLKLQNMF
ncbi:uncharacterized protein LOC109847553 [Asparagus officinalis]|uniref:uncharacterized protein LOC109847553 n=1 Tax=Asparagus officinalis TaxID=4686 RepID=UPI00098E0FB9|nr:uncharacterized protein LOC109847553 [Asparagus officinalis]